MRGLLPAGGLSTVEVAATLPSIDWAQVSLNVLLAAAVVIAIVAAACAGRSHA